MEKINPKTYCVYALICPIENEIKYVGCSTSVEDRFIYHLRYSCNPKIQKWVNFLNKLAQKPVLTILHPRLRSRVSALTLETKIINQNIARGNKLLNTVYRRYKYNL